MLQAVTAQRAIKSIKSTKFTVNRAVNIARAKFVTQRYGLSTCKSRLPPCNVLTTAAISANHLLQDGAHRPSPVHAADLERPSDLAPAGRRGRAVPQFELGHGQRRPRGGCAHWHARHWRVLRARG